MRARLRAFFAAVLWMTGSAHAADYKVLRTLQAGPPTVVTPLTAGAKTRPVQFARILIHPKDGEAWAVAYLSVPVAREGEPPPKPELLTWQAGQVDAETASFQRAFDEELKAAGFNTAEASSLFGDSTQAADLKVGVLVDDIEGRFCLDCPNLFNRKAVPATVLMSANWEIYSALDRKVVARVKTSGGANHMGKLQGSVQPAVLAAFRENVRQLLIAEDFRRLVVNASGAPILGAAAAPPMVLRTNVKPSGVTDASQAVALVFAADGSGSGFLISPDGYLLTNQHVVGASKYVKLKWADGKETLGEVVRTDTRRDVALLKADAAGRMPLSLRKTVARQGETVFAIGTPLDERLQNTMTRGIVSATRDIEGQTFIQSDVGVTHGNSGGPLIDEQGAVLGLTVMGLYAEQSKSLNLFIPIGSALEALAVTPAP